MRVVPRAVRLATSQVQGFPYSVMDGAAGPPPGAAQPGYGTLPKVPGISSKP